MKLARLIGLAGVVVTAASWLAALSRDRRVAARVVDRADKDRWEDEGGATRAGPQPPSNPTMVDTTGTH